MPFKDPMRLLVILTVPSGDSWGQHQPEGKGALPRLGRYCPNDPTLGSGLETMENHWPDGFARQRFLLPFVVRILPSAIACYFYQWDAPSSNGNIL
jgi:hypothetical protein